MTTTAISDVVAKEAILIAKRDGLEAAEDYLNDNGGHFHGVESISLEGRELHYLNAGDTYDHTLCEEDGSFFWGSWGSWYEASENEICEENDVIRCAYCSHFTPNNEENWHDVVCESCGHHVGGD